MQALENLVEIGKCTVKLHWPTVACKECAGEVTEVSIEMYTCVSCGHISHGTTKLIDATVQRIDR